MEIKSKILIVTFFLLSIVILFDEVHAQPSMIGSFYPSNIIEITKQDYIDEYINWKFIWTVSEFESEFEFVEPFFSDIKNCNTTSLSNCSYKCWGDIKNAYLQNYSAEKICIDFNSMTNYPLVNLTQNIAFEDFEVDMTEGKGKFKIKFLGGFKDGESARLGFDSTVINTVWELPFYPNQRSICKDGAGNLHVTWRYNTTSVAYANSTDGINWIVNNSFINGSISDSREYSSISCDGNNITVAYELTQIGHAMVAISTNNGLSWVWKDIFPTIPLSPYQMILVERRGNSIYFVYVTEDADQRINFTKSTDGGATWISPVVVASPLVAADLGNPSIVVNGAGGNSDRIDMTFSNTSDNNIWYVNSTNSGTNWGAPIKLIQDISMSYSSITFNGAKLYVSAWNFFLNDILFVNSTDRGITWLNRPTGYERIDLAGTTTDTTRYPSTTVNNKGYPIVFWEQNSANPNYDIVYRTNNGTHWNESVVNITGNNLGNILVNTPYKYYDDNKIHYIWRNGTAVAPYQIFYDYISIEVAPQWMSNSTMRVDGTQYGTTWGFQINWTDANNNFDNATFQFGRPVGTYINYTKVTSIATKNDSSAGKDTWYINFTQDQLGKAGTYNFTWFGIDIAGNQNKTDTIGYVINKNTTPQVYSFSINDTYINFNQSVRIFVNTSLYDDVFAEIQTPKSTFNKSLAYNGSFYVFNITKTDLGDVQANVSQYINITNIYFGSTNYTTMTNSTTLNFSYASTTAIDPGNWGDSPDPTTNAAGQSVTIWANYTDTENMILTGSTCEVTIFSSVWSMTYSSANKRYEVTISTYQRTPNIYTYSITCSNSSYQTQSCTNTSQTVEVKEVTGGGPAGGGGGGGEMLVTANFTVSPEYYTIVTPPQRDFSRSFRVCNQHSKEIRMKIEFTGDYKTWASPVYPEKAEKLIYSSPGVVESVKIEPGVCEDIGALIRVPEINDGQYEIGVKFRDTISQSSKIVSMGVTVARAVGLFKVLGESMYNKIMFGMVIDPSYEKVELCGGNTNVCIPGTVPMKIPMVFGLLPIATVSYAVYHLTKKRKYNFIYVILAAVFLLVIIPG